MTKLKVGERITWLDAGSMYPHKGTIRNRERDGSWTVTLPSGYVGMVQLAHEGLTWVRGHHDVESPEVAALQTAYALVDPFGVLAILTRG